MSANEGPGITKVNRLIVIYIFSLLHLWGGGRVRNKYSPDERKIVSDPAYLMSRSSLGSFKFSFSCFMCIFIVHWVSTRFLQHSSHIFSLSLFLSLSLALYFPLCLSLSLSFSFAISIYRSIGYIPYLTLILYFVLI